MNVENDWGEMFTNTEDVIMVNMTSYMSYRRARSVQAAWSQYDTR